MRNTFVDTLVKLAEKDERIFVITPDLGFSVLEPFEEKFPERFLNVGIAEANAISIASGLALSGKIVYVYSIMPFVTMRPFEQIRVDVAYMNTNVRLIGVGAGVTYGPAGATHHAIEDIALMRALPNMTVFSPSDPWEVEQAVIQSLVHDGPIYFRLAKRGEPVISDTNHVFAFGRANLIGKGDDLTLLFTGNASDLALEVKQELQQKNISASVVSMHSIKPFDYSCLETIAKEGKPIFTLEEHSIIGGLGSVVSEFLAESSYHPKFKRFGLPDEYSHYVGSQKHIREKMGFSKKEIVKQIMEILNDRS